MFARLTFIKISPGNFDQLKKIFNEEVAPVVRSQKGNIGCWLMEPTDTTDDLITLTEWISSADAEEYEASGIYKQLVETAKEYYTAIPVLKTYNIADSKIVMPTAQ